MNIQPNPNGTCSRECVWCDTNGSDAYLILCLHPSVKQDLGISEICPIAYQRLVDVARTGYDLMVDIEHEDHEPEDWSFQVCFRRLRGALYSVTWIDWSE